MNVVKTPLEGLLVLEPQVFEDDRGCFLETMNSRKLLAAGIESEFVQENFSYSRRGVLRGLHYQLPFAQGKLARVISGEVFDVAVDMRANSPTLGQWFGVFLSCRNQKMFWVPEGFAHGLLVTSEEAYFSYKTTEYYHAESEHQLTWDDESVAVDWPSVGGVEVSEKDRRGKCFADAAKFGFDGGPV